MFDYCFWPDGLDVELNKQLDNFHYQAQLYVDGELFLRIANKILKAQVKGKYFELIVLLPKGFRTLENANLLHRMVLAGAQVGVLEISNFDPDREEFGIFDNKLIHSNKKLEGEIINSDYFLKKHKEFYDLMTKSKAVTTTNEGIKINFKSDKYFVTHGHEINLNWDIINATSILMNPGLLSVEPFGTKKIKIEEDLLFTITAKNGKHQSFSSIFIKCLEEEYLKLTVSVFNSEVDAYVEISNLAKNKGIYAVYINDLVKIEWICKPGARLSEPSLGKLPNIGFHHFICAENTGFSFEVDFSNSIDKKQIEIFTISAKELENHGISMGNYSKNKAKRKNSLLHNYFISMINLLLKFKQKS